MKYLDFLKSKMAIATDSGFDVPDKKINTALKPHQRDIVKWAVKGGKRAVFAKFGLGKSVIQLEWCTQVITHEGGKALIICPLGVKQEFVHDAVEILGYDAPAYVKTMAEVRTCSADIMITNYERVRDGDIDVKYFTATSLDEAAVLRSFGSKTYQEFLKKFNGVPYKLVATATPDPNKYKELIHYAGYLEIMDTGQALTRFFQRDSTKANNLTLYPHKEEEFWLWVSSWAVFVSKPSDVNPTYSDEGYDLPELKINYHRLAVSKDELSVDKFGQSKLFDEATASLQDEAKIKRESISQRVAEAAKIIAENPEDSFIIWHDLEEERHEIKRQIPNVVDIYGSMDIDLRERRVIDFANGKIKLFATKKILSGSGCNFQKHCHRAIFIGIDENGPAYTVVSKGPGAVCIGNGQTSQLKASEKVDTLDCMHDQKAIIELSNGIVRRLTPLECERLQGYPDGWTAIGEIVGYNVYTDDEGNEYKDPIREYTDGNGKRKKVTDSARYKALGNSISIPNWFYVLQKLTLYCGADTTMASLFDGIGGFPLIWETLNGKGSCVWASEIEEFPIAVTKFRFNT